MGIATSKPQSPEIWVAPDGNDNNIGTRDRPYASIQQAVDDLYEECGDTELKRVRLKVGRYDESVIVNSQRWEFIGEKSNLNGAFPEGRVSWHPNGTVGPALFITNGTKESAQAYIDDGGPSYTEDTGAGIFTYDGPTLQDRAIRQGMSNNQDMEITVENVYFYAESNVFTSDVGVVVGAAFHSSGDTESTLRNVEFNNVAFAADFGGTNGYIAYFKNVSRLGFSGLVQAGPLVTDNCKFMSYDRSKISAYTNSGILDGWIVTIDSSLTGDEVPAEFSNPATLWSNFQEGVGDSLHYYIADADDTYSLYVDWNQVVKGNFRLMGSGILGQVSNWVPYIQAKSTCYFDAGDAWVNRVEASNVEVNSGSIDLGVIEARQNVTVNGGDLTIHGGTIRGNLTVNAPATADLTNVTVKGNLEGDGNITMNGGGYLGANNNTGTLTHNPLKTT